MFFPKDPGRARARFRLPAGRLVLFVGRLEPHKGPDMAIRAFAEAAARDAGATSDVSLVVVGGSPGERFDAKRGRLLRLAAALGLAGRVTFLPAQPQDRLAELYSAAEVVVVPSRSESFGLVALEAQACGTPVVAAAAGGLPHVVADGSTGFLVRGGEPGKYADRILRILSDPRRSRRMGEAGVVRALGFSWDATTAGILAVYGELITAPSTSGGGLAP